MLVVLKAGGSFFHKMHMLAMRGGYFDEHMC